MGEVGDEDWKALARLEAAAATNNLLLQWLYQMYFDQRPEGGETAFRYFATQVFDLLKRKPMIDVPADRDEAAVSDMSEAMLLQFLDQLALRMGMAPPAK